MKGKIAEVFESIQGEGIYCGERQVFVRFFGCNLACAFCDTKLEYFNEYEPGQLLNKIKSFRGGFHSVSFTGGEPLLQKDFLREILKLTKEAGFKNYLETNGTLADELEEVIDYLDVVSMDVKLPSSTGMDDFWKEHSRFLRIASQKEVFVKAVISLSTHKKDLSDALSIIREVNVGATLVLQPDSFQRHIFMDEKLEDFKKHCHKNEIVACVIPQMHKRLGVK